MAETSDRMSSIAARYNNITAARVIALTENDRSLEVFVRDIRSMSASLRRQDETKGLRERIKEFFSATPR
jgi:hypothetical protein